MRARAAAETPDAATTWWPAAARAAPSTAPTRPAPMMPMIEAGRACYALMSDPVLEIGYRSTIKYARASHVRHKHV